MPLVTDGGPAEGGPPPVGLSDPVAPPCAIVNLFAVRLSLKDVRLRSVRILVMLL